MSAPYVITSTQNPFFRHCLLLRKNRQRRKAGQFLIDGEVEILRAAGAGIELQHILVSSQQILSPELELLAKRVSTISIERLSPQLLSKLDYGQVSGQPIGLARTPQWELTGLQLDQQSLVLVLDQTEKPGNLGACMRTAAACGASAVILTQPVCDPFNANAIRASRGTMFSVPVAITTVHQFLELADDLQLALFAARVAAEKSLWQLPLEQGAAIILGNETDGLGDDWQVKQVQNFTIPMSQQADSLNLSISAAISLYEAVRQRTCAKFDAHSL